MRYRDQLIYDFHALKESNYLGQRLSEARKECDLSQKELAARLLEYNIQISSGAVSKWEKGDSLPNPYQFLALCHILKIQDVLSYFTDSTSGQEGSVPELNEKGQELLHLMKDALIASGQYTPEGIHSLHNVPEPEVYMKVFDEPAAAGPGNFLTDGSYEMIPYPARSVPAGTDFGVRVSGVSMMPRYVDQQVAWVKQCSSLSNGDIGVFLYDGNAYIKKFTVKPCVQPAKEPCMMIDGQMVQAVTLYSLNRECADLDVTVEPDHSFYIVGRVLN